MRKKAKNMCLTVLLAGSVILSVTSGMSFAAVSGNDAAPLEKSVKATPSEASKTDENAASGAVGNKKETAEIGKGKKRKQASPGPKTAPVG